MVSFEASDAIVVLVVGVILIQGLWLSFITYLMFKRAQEKQTRRQRPDMDDAVIEDVFLLHRSGLLIRHLTRRLKPQADSDILSGMLRAVQEFVKDSFQEERGELRDLTFGELSISLCSGRNVILAAVIRGERPEDIVDQMRAAVDELEAEHGPSLTGWDGRLSAVRFVDEYLRKLLGGGYNSRPKESSPPGIAVARGTR